MDTIKFAKMNDTVIIPSKREEDGCYDLYVNFDEETFLIKSKEIENIPTKLKSMFHSKYRIGIRERGSNTKSKLLVVAGQIDSNYRGEWFLSLYNSTDVDIIIDKSVVEVTKTYENGKLINLRVPYKKAFAQFAVEEIPIVEIKEVSEEEIDNNKTNRNLGKIGSTGK